MGVGTRLSRQFGEQKVHLLEAIASRLDKIVVRRLDHRAQPLLDLLWSLRCRLQERHSASAP
ncbi:hypothetical protein, partial [Pseudomonas aeruginosa]|uniref:hypothetical protein n=1 Tax=Pseudomonas aeruginosa TaxID=287 RepID=UPI001C642C89